MVLASGDDAALTVASNSNSHSKSSCPFFAVEVAVLNGLGDMLRQDQRTVLDVGDGTRHLQDSIEGPCRKAQDVHGLLQQVLTFLVDFADFPHHFGRHHGIAVDAGPLFKTFLLPLSRRDHTCTHISPGLGFGT